MIIGEHNQDIRGAHERLPDKKTERARETK
jgi:hypothetical protein